MTESPIDRNQIVGRHAPFVQQLFDDRQVVELPEVRGKVESQSRPRGNGDSIHASDPVSGVDDGRLPPTDVGEGRVVHAVAH